MPQQFLSFRRSTLFALVLIAQSVGTRPTSAVEIEGVQPAALDQPRINVCIRREPKGQPLAAKADAAAGGLQALLGEALGGGGGGPVINIRAFIDTGASGVMLSRNTFTALGIQPANHRGRPVAFHDVGVGGTEEFGVSEPLYLFLAASAGVGAEPGDASQYSLPIGPVRVQLAPGGGLLDAITGGLDVVGMPAMKGRVVVIDPTPVDTFADTIRTTVLDARKDRRAVPKVDRTVVLSYASFARFTRTEPAGAQAPALADNPFVGPSPVTPSIVRRAAANRPAAADGAATRVRPNAAGGDVPPVVVTLNGKHSAGSWLLDTGAAASMISTAQAKQLGVTYAEGTEGTDAPKLNGAPLNEQFTFTVGGVGGQKKMAGFFLDTLTLPTREGEPLVYKRAPVLVMDITVQDPHTKQQVTLDGILGMNYFVATANIEQAGLMPNIDKLTAGPYELIVFDEPAGTLGLKLKPEFLRGANPKGRGTVEIKPAAKRPARR
jgi:hypothetical protein